MKKIGLILKVIFLFILLLFYSCDKGYQVRFTNYYTEPMDTVTIGQGVGLFVNVPFNVPTKFMSIKKGTYIIRMVSKSRAIIHSSITIPDKGTGKRTIEIDGLKTVNILEE